ncbi:MAG: hypothetical protein HC820_00135 [Hydrococcus sp. RM1_1_31]|nr:hypothetical protein [Hydrococcus sp. RM1_1_31]
MSNHQEDFPLMSTKELYRLWRETGEQKYFYAFIDAKENEPENLKMTQKILRTNEIGSENLGSS